MISAREALERLREGNRRFASELRSHDPHATAHAPPRVGRGPGAVRHHPRLLRLARAGGDRLRPGPRRPLRDPRRRQHRRAVAGRQRRVRRGALRHAAGGGARPLAVRRDPGDARGAAAGRSEDQSRNLRSIVDRVRPSVEALLATELRTRSGRAGASTRCARTSAPRRIICATAPRCSSS